MTGCCVALAVPQAALPHMEAVLEPLLGAMNGALVTDGPDAAGMVPVRLYLEQGPEQDWLLDVIGIAAEAAGIPAPELTVEPLPDVDWVTESQKLLPPVHAGRFWLHGAHVTRDPPAGAISLLVEAGAAFGTGRHESTSGCLIALSDLAKRRRVQPVRRALDMGCGSGVLAMAVARLWHCPVLGVDNDRTSVVVARANAQANGVAEWLRAVWGEGYKGAAVARAGPYDLIVANILAGPLMAMANDLTRHLAPGGVAILSGLLNTQVQAVTARHRAAGLVLTRRYRLGDWSTLVLARPHSTGLARDGWIL